MIMSWVGMVTGRPSAGLRMLLLDSMRMRASACASADSGTWTAIWSPSKSALNAEQTSGWIWMALPSTSCGSKAWMPRRCSGGARFSRTGCSVMTSSSTSQTTARPRSTMRLADLMFCAWLRSTSRFMTNGLNSSSAICLGRPHWCSFSCGPTTMTEPPLLALEHVGQRLQRPVARAGDRTTAAAVVEQRVDGLLQHPLLVVDDDPGRAEVEQSLQPVVAVDDAAVQVVEVGRGESATVELHHRAQVRRDDRDAVQDHAHGAVAGVEERRDDLEALERADLLLALARADRLAQRLALGVEVEALQQPLQRLGAHAAGEVLAEAVAQLAVEQLVGDQLLDLELAERVEHLRELVELALRAVAQLAQLALGALAHLAAHVALRALGLEGGDVVLELLLARLGVGVALVLDALHLDAHGRLDGGEVAVPRVDVDRRDQVGRE